MGESKLGPKADRKRVTLRDVAEEAGVSLKTASNVINHSGRMTDSTREKVQEVSTAAKPASSHSPCQP